MKLLCDRRGEAAIAEMSIIIPLVTLVIISIAAFASLCCDRIALEALCDKYASLASDPVAYNDAGAGDSVKGKAYVFLDREKNPYASPDYEEFYDELTDELRSEAWKNVIINAGVIHVQIERETKLTGEYVRVSIEKRQGNGPASKYLPAYRVESVRRIGNPDGTVRNLDLIDDAVDAGAAYVKNSESLKKALSKIMEKK